MDIETLVMDLIEPWWSDEWMRRDVWNQLLACRTTLHRCGYSATSDEYETLSFLLRIHHERFQ